uniref:Piriformospora indica-insensitive protein 2-like n=1 Tax=Nelumbo nucifera TaxID=4432 RepID=A0A822YXC2_NELNU|nr:TPA_asm: hypothetical protein HUJ06_007464 [Nelumbo nucifera]
MAISSSLFFRFPVVFLVVFSHAVVSQQILTLSSDEQESVYQVLEAINSDIQWRYLFPDDLCSSAPHGVVCDYFTDESEVLLPGFLANLSSSLEELVFIENPSLAGTLNGKLGNFTRLKKLVLTGSNVSGEIPDSIGDMLELEQITITRSNLSGGVPLDIGKLKKLKILDLSYNRFQGQLPDSIGNLTELLKLDLGSNYIDGRIPETLLGLQKLEFLDLSYNLFGNFGIPLSLAEMPSLRELYLSGNSLGGQIPEIWEKLGGILRLGFSGLGLVGKIPASMGVFLTNISYLGLDNNKLEGTVPMEFGLLESVNEINLENNRLSGRLPISAKFSAQLEGKLKLGGNPNFCVDASFSSATSNSGLEHLKLCSKTAISHHVLFSGCSSLRSSYLLSFLGYCFVFVF